MLKTGGVGICPLLVHLRTNSYIPIDRFIPLNQSSIILIDFKATEKDYERITEFVG